MASRGFRQSGASNVCLNFVAAEAASADVSADDLTIEANPLMLKVHVPAPFAAAMGMAELISNLGTTFTNQANSRHISPPKTCK